MNLNDLFTEEKVRLDPKCWTGKKIGNPKTKMKGGTRVNNCVPAESINEFAPPGGDDRGPNDEEILRRLAAQWWSGTEQQMAKAQQTLQALGWEIGPDESGNDDAGVYVYRIGDNDGRDTLAFAHSELSLDEGVAEEYELAGVGVAYELGRRAYKERKTARDNPYSATREARKNDEWAKGLERGKHDANDARHFRSSVREQGMAEGKVEPQVDHRGDVDLDADIEVLGVDYNTGTWKITYNGKPYTVKADYFSREDLSRWQIPDYDVEIINRNGQNIMKVIDWDNEGSSKTDRQIRMVNTIIAYLDTENAQDIQYMAWKDQELDNVTAHEFYNDIRYFYHKDQQKIDQTVQWLLKNMTNDEAREGLADYIKNPVNPMDWNTKENLKNNRTYMLYMAFSYSREGNTEMTPGMNLPKIQLNDPDDEDELQYQLDALFKKVDLKFDAFENKIVELSKKFSLPNPDLGSGMGNREMFWELICQTAWPKEYKYTRNAATNILNFKAAVDKYAKSFNSSLIKIGLPGISEYAIWYGVLSDDLTEQQVNYFATPEGFANVANGKIDVSKMINDNMQRKSLEEKLGDNRPKLGSKRDAGKSVRKWRKSRGLDETGVAKGLNEAVGGNYLYHATSSDINVLKNIISNGLITNDSNQERTGSKLRALSFTRNWRYALTSTDDDNQGTTGIANGVIFVVDQSILKQKNKMQSVDRPADIINEFKAVLAALPTAERVNDLFQLMDGSVTPEQLAALSQIAGSSTPIMNGRQFILAVAKPYLANKTNQQALANAQSKIKQAISYFVKTSAGKSIASAGGSTGSEYEEVILTPLNYVPFKDLGVVGYMINPAVDPAKQQEIRNLFAKVGVNEMPIPNSTRPGKGVAEDQLDEKSVSQAQFRTMAAAAHNPEFAKKVGIKQSVAKEFNQADKDSNYKKLPDRTTEGAPVTTTPGSINPGGAVDNFKQQMANNTEVAYQKKLSGVGEGEQQKGADYRDPPEADYGDDYQDLVARMKKLAGLGPLKTVYDPAKRQYRNIPTAVQPKK